MAVLLLQIDMRELDWYDYRERARADAAPLRCSGPAMAHAQAV